MSQNDSGSVQKVKTIKHCKTMKKLVFLLLTCLAAMTMQAQVLTSKTIIDVYDEVSMNGEPGFAYNADYAADGTIETMYVYQRRKDTLKPLYQFRYVYSPDGLLLTRTTLCWRYGKWLTASRLDYSLQDSRYTVDYSRYSRRSSSFEAPIDRMVYQLLPNDQASCVSFFHRDPGNSDFHITAHVAVSPFTPDDLWCLYEAGL